MVSRGKVKTIKVSLNRPNLFYEIVDKPSGRANAAARLVSEIRSLGGQSAIVYCIKRDETEQVAGDLRAAGISAEFYHAGMEDERDERQAQFMSGETQVIVATIAFGMGIDKEDVRMVFHWDLPKSIEAYYQETGRAGRDGDPARCVLLYSRGAIMDQQWFARQHEEASVREHALSNVDRIAALCETTGCRRKMMLEYFGEEVAAECDSCDNCTAEWEEEDVSQIWRAFATTAVQTREMFGSTYLIQLLRGFRNERIESNGHDELVTFGALGVFSQGHLRDVFYRLLEAGYLERHGEYQSVRLTARGRQALRDNEPVKVRKRVEKEHAPAVTTRPRPTVDAVSRKFDPALFEKLRELRLKIAREIGKPAYVVFPDTTLKRIAESAPTSLEAMGRVSGVGPWKLQEYGERFVALVVAHVGGSTAGGPWVEAGDVSSADASSADESSAETAEPSRTADACPALLEELRALQDREPQDADADARRKIPEWLLLRIVERLPLTRSELEAMPGVGATRSNLFGVEFVQAIASHVPACARCKSVKRPSIVSLNGVAKPSSGPGGNSEDVSGLLRQVVDTLDLVATDCDLFDVASILRGDRREDLTTNGHAELPTFGAASDRAYVELKILIGQFVDLRFVAPTTDGSRALSVTQLGRQMIDSGAPVWLPNLDGASGEAANEVDEPSNLLLRNVVETIDATGRIYELHWIAAILLGTELDYLAVNGHTGLRTFGIEKGRSHDELRRLLWGFIDLGYIARRNDGSGVLEVTELGRRVIASGDTA